MPSSHGNQLAPTPQRRTRAAATASRVMACTPPSRATLTTRQLASLPGPYPVKVVLVHLCEPVGAKTAMTKARRVTIWIDLDAKRVSASSSN
jgi:hypothetical protein